MSAVRPVLPPVLALEISPLGERQFTGIANVTRMLAREMLADGTVEPRFMMGRSEVPPALVEKIVGLEGGDVLWWLSGRLDGRPRFEGLPGRPVVGLYPSTKPHRRLFPTEVLVVHDLTTVVTPQFHTRETLAFWQRHLLPDMLSSDLLVAVSQSTAADIRDYFPQVADIPLAVVPLAPCTRLAGAPFPPGTPVEPFVMVLGTLEPRKNVTVVFEMLARHPSLLERARFVFVGRWGWGARAADLLRDHGLEAMVAAERIVLPGFVSDEARDALLASAVATVYPSRYEGFGLPVLESMHFGTPVITTYASSLPEVGGEVAAYFDMDDPDSLLAAVTEALDRHGSGAEKLARARRVARAARFNWTTAYRRIRDAALAVPTDA